MRTEARQRWLDLVRGMRPRHFLLAPPALAAVIVSLSLLYAIPPLRFGWWTALGGNEK